MQFDFSKFGRVLGGGSGIEQLMDDLGYALAEGGEHMRMLGGGNPATIPEVAEIWRREMRRLLDKEPQRFDRMLANYDPCRGNPSFLRALADMFNRHCGWDITPQNIAVTNGGQTAFFYLFNLLAGEFESGHRKHVLLPVSPEYIGYANQSATGPTFRAAKPQLDMLDDVTFKYRVNFDELPINDDTGLICVSRPTNPSGNVLTDDEVRRLSDLAKQHRIPLVIDNAYGAPFPNIVFDQVTPIWDAHIVLTFSLSKLGLPGTRTGIVVGPTGITAAINSMNAVVGLANGNIGQVLVTPLVENDELLGICQQTIRPFYQQKSRQALQWLQELLPPGTWRVHSSEGALFLWLWFPDLPIATAELYQRLKQRGVLIVPGEYFFFGLEEPWDHAHQCIRLTFSMPEKTVREGMAILGEELRQLMGS
ncbi:MAG: valine--pyruvate transaminase [Pirellulaceae bacterium]|nr:valine--pyruvate transaminase [Planctomycetales bacterium]